MSTSISTVGVVVPAHDEEELLPACLAALATASAAATRAYGVRVEVVVVLDSCSDGTGRIAAAAGALTVPVRVRNVGRARAAGYARLLSRHRAADLWLAGTDADSEVPADWLVRQLRHARRGAHAVVGTVVVDDWSSRPTGLAAVYDSRYQHRSGHPHVHGANLGLSAAAYTAVGGVPPLALAEDVALVAAVERAGLTVVRAADLPVRTSPRVASRAPGGFGDHLSGLAG